MLVANFFSAQNQNKNTISFGFIEIWPGVTANLIDYDFSQCKTFGAINKNLLAYTFQPDNYSENDIYLIENHNVFWL